ncbi:hypothetical protein ACWD25_53705, partial [Streptomyces sp. NPDC002920]
LDANACGRHSATPVLVGAGPLLVTLVVLGRDVRTTGASATVDADGTVTVRFPDGTGAPVSAGPVSPPDPAPGGTS